LLHETARLVSALPRFQNSLSNIKTVLPINSFSVFLFLK
jgi:hypothetical protein